MQKILSLIAIVLFVAGCGSGDSSQTPVARIGNRTLTSDEVKAALRSDVEPTPGQTRQFVQRWISSGPFLNTPRSLPKRSSSTKRIGFSFTNEASRR